MPREGARWIPLLLALALAAVGCGDDDDKPGPVGPAPGPDLIILAVTFVPDSPTTSDNVTANFTVRNDGNLAAGGTTLSVQVDGAPSCASVMVSSLSSGRMQNVPCELGRLAAGTRSVEACVDPGGRVSEWNELNNCIARSLAVTD